MVAQLLLEIILDAPLPNDYVEIARKNARYCVQNTQRINQILKDEQILNTRPKKLTEYVGEYKSTWFDFNIDIVKHGKGLRMSPQGLKDLYIDLHHYHNDVFAWHCDRDAMAREAMLPANFPAFYKVIFDTDNGSVTKMRWVLDEKNTMGGVFVKGDSPSILTPIWKMAERHKLRQLLKALKKESR